MDNFLVAKQTQAMKLTDKQLVKKINILLNTKV